MKAESQELKEERKFLHDISNPLCTGMFFLDEAIEGFSAHPDVNPEGLLQIKKSYQAFQKVIALLHERREVLIKRGETAEL